MHAFRMGTVHFQCMKEVTMTTLNIQVENLNDKGGLFATPVWVAAHNGNFDTFDVGSAASVALERIAEDGNLSVLRSDFVASGAGVDGVVFGNAGVGGVIDPSEIASTTLSVDPSTAHYFSYAAMVVPSNDAFVANSSPTFLKLFDDDGNFTGSKQFVVTGNRIYDAGTEVNTERDAAFINQTAPNTGVTENGVVQLHEGFIGSLGNPGGTPVILGGTTAAGTALRPAQADFTQPNFELLRFTITLDGDNAPVSGDKGANLLEGTATNDIINGNAGNDTVNGLGGDDLLTGDRGNDALTGAAGDDTIHGGLGNDVLSGNDGQDDLYGSLGRDTLTGGDDADIFHFESLSSSERMRTGSDLITDFEVGVDKVNLQGLGFTAFDTDGGFTEAGELRVLYNATRDVTIVTSDNTGFAFNIAGDVSHSLTLGDFIL
jgi:Ca2+-binding RTX toxin-like protein